METIIDFKNLSIYTDKSKERALVKDVSMQIPKHKIVGIVGESGSGKSLTMKRIVGILPENLVAETESFLFDGQAVKSGQILPISMIFQDPMTSLNPLRTVGFHLVEVIQRYQKLDKKAAFEKGMAMLEKVGLTQPELRMNQYPFELSGGMRQRIMIAMALLAEPKVLIADEPTTALDVTIQLQILSILFQLQQELGLTIIIVSHDFGVIAGLCDYVKVMYQGQIVEEGTVSEIFETPQHPYTQKLMALAQFDFDKAQLVLPSVPSVLKPVSETHFVRVEA